VIGFWLLVGLLTGALNGLTLWWTVSRLRAGMGDSALRLTTSGMLVRLALVTGVLIAALLQGIVPGLAVFGGLCITRWATVIWAQVQGMPGAAGIGRQEAGRTEDM